MNILIFLYLLLTAPKLLWDRVVRNKRHPQFLQRLGFHLPKADRPVIWIHAVSVGEVKAAQPLFKELKKKEKGAFFLITTTSQTGQEEAKRSLSGADAFAYLPIDFTWVVRKWVKHFNPRQFILVESDFWYHLLKELKNNQTKITLVSGKLSEKSARRFLYFRRFSRKLFSYFDHLCVQNEDHFRRFFPLLQDPSCLHITGNLKLDIEPQKISGHLEVPQPAITISCTHDPEEELLLSILEEEWFIILAPRHPERFNEVAQLLEAKKIPFTRWSQPQPLQRVLLVDTMGQLPLCYTQSRVTIVGGSYIDGIGGHNVLEPCLYGAPVIFGPYIFGQKEFAAKAIESGAGMKIGLSELKETLKKFFSDGGLEQQMREAAIAVVEANRGATQKTLHFFR